MTAGFNIALPTPVAANDYWRPVSPENEKHLSTVEASRAALMTIRRQEQLAFAHLALQQRRNSWTYRNWAIEARRDGKMAEYLKWRDKAKRAWRDAKANLTIAQNRMP